MQDAKVFDPACAEERERRRRTRDLRRNYFLKLPVDTNSPVAAACHFLIPWNAHHYPGIGRGLRQLVNRRVDIRAIGHWRSGNSTPMWALELLAEEIGRRARLGLKVEEALRAQIEAKKAKPRKPRGVEIIDDEIGLPKFRNRVGE